MERKVSLELRSISPVRCGNVCGLVYGLFMVPWIVLFLPVLLLIPIAGDAGAEGFLAGGVMLVLVLLYPVFGFIMGWLGGLIFAFIYNVVVKWIGGVLCEVKLREDQVQTPTTFPAP